MNYYDVCETCDEVKCTCDHVCDECENCGDNTSDEFQSELEAERVWSEVHARAQVRAKARISTAKQCLACFFAPCQCFGKRKVVI